MTPDTKKNVLRGSGFFLISVFTGLAVYQSPPGSWAELGQWIWQPAMQGVLAMLTSLGLNAATESKKK